MKLIGIATVAVTVLIHAAGTTRWIRHLRLRALAAQSSDLRRSDSRRSGLVVLVETALVLITLHVAEVLT
ncbi:MAG: hypothetical protein AAGC60_03725 [Acidobacteriota bacterium]